MLLEQMENTWLAEKNRLPYIIYGELTVRNSTGLSNQPMIVFEIYSIFRFS